RRPTPLWRDVLKPQLQHLPVALERELAHLFGERDRLARDDIFGDRGGRVDARRPPGGIAGLARRPGAAARPGFGERLLRRRRLQQCREGRLLRLDGRDLPLIRLAFAPSILSRRYG